MQVAVNDHFDDKRIKRSKGGGFDGGCEAAEKGDGSKNGHEEFPLGIPERATNFPQIPGWLHRCNLRPAAHAPQRSRSNHYEGREESAEKHPLDGDFRDDGVDNERKARWQQKTERSRTGQQAEGIFLRISGPGQHGHKQAAEREDGDAGSAGEGSKESAHKNGDDCRTATELAEQRVKNANEPPGRAALSEKITGKSEQRQSGERRIGNQSVVGDGNRGNGLPATPKNNE